MTTSAYSISCRKLLLKEGAEILSSSTHGLTAKIRIRRSKATASVVAGFTMLTVSKTVASRRKLRGCVPPSGVWPIVVVGLEGELNLSGQVDEMKRRIKMLKES